MKKNLIRLSLLVLTSVAAISCSKSDNDGAVISKPLTVIGKEISSTTLPEKDANGRAIPLKGTMLSGKTYRITADVSINAGDTLYLQPGVNVIIEGDGTPGKSPMFLVNGTIISDGTKEKQNYFTVPESLRSTGDYNNNIAQDPAYKGYWSGFQGTATCKLMAFRWTHIEYTGGAYGANAAIFKAKDSDPAPAIYMNSDPDGAYGKFILEDSWLYGSVDDCIGKLQHVYVNIMRNTLSKLGGNGGEGINLKNDCYGDMAYNLCYGIATNGLKTAGIDGSSTIVNIYNNTLVNCGFRQQKATRNGSINTETNAGGYIYNNIIVNSKQGLRITYSSEKGRPSDVLNTAHNNNLTYIGNNTKDASGNPLMIYIEPHQYTLKQAFDINGYVNGAIIGTGADKGTNIGSNNIDVNQYNPIFKNYDAKARAANYLSSSIPAGADFHLSPGSPAINAGVYPGGSGKNAMPTKEDAPLLKRYGFPMTLLSKKDGLDAAKITPPNRDLGAFPSDGSGNQHTY